MKKININLQNSSLSLSLVSKKYRGFTLAEILLSLSIIGIVAAIALPSLLGNVHERAWETQKKALYTRFSQALPLLPNLNGYGQLEEVKNGDDTEILDTAAETFIRDGLSKVMKITNICDNDHLTDCGLPDKIIPINGGSAKELSTIKQISGFNPLFIRSADPHADDFVMLNVKAAAFETVNGESILVYYNPNCEPDLKENKYYVQAKMCANFVYDLNGKKGPNTVGKDIGFITAMYSTDPVVAAPIPYPENLPDKAKTADALQKCKEAYGEDAKLPNLAEISSLFCNGKIIGNMPGGVYASSIKEWAHSSTGINYKASSDGERIIRCVKR